MNLDDQIQSIKKQLDDVKTRKIQNELKLKSLEKEKEQLLHECHLLNVDPHKIESVIKQQEELVEEELKEIQQILDQLGAIKY